MKITILIYNEHTHYEHNIAEPTLYPPPSLTPTCQMVACQYMSNIYIECLFKILIVLNCILRTSNTFYQFEL